MQGHDGQNAAGCQSGPGDEQGRRVSADNGEHSHGRPPKCGIAAPDTQQCSAADDERRERQRNKENVKAKDRAGAVSIDQTPDGLRRFKGRGLKVPREEGGHEQRAREDEQ